MADWSPFVILPNLFAKQDVGCEVVAFVSCHDPRVQAFSTACPKFKELLSRFTDAFGVPLEPVVFIIRDDVKSKLAGSLALLSFRDLVAMCVIPYARSLKLVYPNSNGIMYSNSFWLYPWMLGENNQHLFAATPAFLEVNEVENFHGQSSPDLPVMELRNVDEPLFEALILQWKRHYLGKRQRWEDRALFRSLNMAAQAAQLPAGADTTLYDLGRMSALWVSAFEILAHPRTANSGLRRVYSLFERVSYLDPNVGQRKYAAYMNQDKKKKPWPRRPLPCWLYGKLYQARCDFLHGNPLGAKPLNPMGSKESLLWLAPWLYRLALTGFLGMSDVNRIRKNANATHAISEFIMKEYQLIIERALLRTRKDPAPSAPQLSYRIFP